MKYLILCLLIIYLIYNTFKITTQKMGFEAEVRLLINVLLMSILLDLKII